ncbi:oxidoreductase [Actinomycetota bacterium]|nr:oxidoreductase [Actinomycetota bacterium]
MTEKKEINDSAEIIPEYVDKASAKDVNVATAGRSKKQLIAIIIASIVAVIGIGLWVFQLAGGMVNTNMRNLDCWGVYIIMFMLFVGLSAGGLIISSVPKVFNIQGFGPISKVAVWVSICCTILAVAFVIVDMGGPLRLWELIVFANLSSPLMWDVIVLTLYLVISLVYLRAILRSEQGKGTKTGLRVLSTVALICAIAVHTVTAWIFGLQAAHDFWYTAILGPWFVTSALLSGLGLVLVIVLALRKTGYVKLEMPEISKMARLLGVFMVIDLYFFACDLLTSGYSGGAGSDVVALLTSGPLAPFFWTEIIFGVVVMLIAFVPKLRSVSLVTVAAVLAMGATLLKRIQLLLSGFQLPNIDYASVVTGPALGGASLPSAPVAGAIVYSPSPLELGIVLGVLALGVALILAGLRFLPLQPTNTNH